MADNLSNRVNLDLNLGPLANPNGDMEPGSGSHTNTNPASNIPDWLEFPPLHRLREASRQRRWRSLWSRVPIPLTTTNLALDLPDRPQLPTDLEGTLEPAEVIKVSENGNGFVENEDVKKQSENEGSFFDCNICFDLAKDPVVTCCGHLFCWPCLYSWLHDHSAAKECPVCKGEVTTKTVTPIYGRGNSKREIELDPSLEIPVRPQARRVESLRQMIHSAVFAIPMEDDDEELGSFSERYSSLVNRVLTARAMLRERVSASAQDNNNVAPAPAPAPSPAQTQAQVGLMESNNVVSGSNGARLLQLFSRTRSSANRAAMLSQALRSSAERLMQNYYVGGGVERNREEGRGGGGDDRDRDSVSSIAAVIQSESQTVDNAAEIDSTVAVSTSSSRRRNDSSRNDMDSGDSRAPRRRRLN